MRTLAIAIATVSAALIAPQAAPAFEPLGTDLRLSFMGPNGNPNYDAGQASVAYSSAANEYLVVWQGDDDTSPLVDNEREIFAQRVSAGGARLGGRIRVSDMGPNGTTTYSADSSSVAYSAASNQYLIVWRGDDSTDEEYEVFGQRLTASGTEIGANDFRISDMGPDGDPNYAAYAPSVVYSSADNQWLVVWHGDDNTAPLVNNEFEVFGQRLTASGTEGGANDFRISDMGPDGNPSYDALTTSAAYSSADNQWLVAWYGDDATDEENEIFGQRLDRTGAQGGANDFRISDMGPDGTPNYGAYAPSVSYSSADNQWLVSWYGDDNSAPLVDNEAEIFGQRLDRTGAELGANDFRISDMGPNGNPNYAGYEPTVAYSSADNQWLVAWYGDDDTDPLIDEENEIFGQRLDRTGAQGGANDFRISSMGPDGDANYVALFPSAAYSAAANQYLVSWSGDDNTGPLVNEENEIFGRRLGERVPPSGGATPPGGAGDSVAPRLTGLRLSPTRFRAYRSGRSVRSARTRGTRVRYRLSEAARVRFRVQRALAGRRVRGQCRRPTRNNRGRPRCKRYRTLRGSFSHQGKTGRNRFKFSGRLARRKLRPAKYRLVATAKDTAGNRSSPKRKPFRIVR
jgi:hypothetical protein